MSLDMALYDENDEEIQSINWFRNPFGLERWAEGNVQLAGGLAEEVPLSLWEVCNNWAYDKAEKVDRLLFLKVVLVYRDTLKSLKDSYFLFDLRAYRQLVEPYALQLARQPGAVPGTELRFRGERYGSDGRLAIPVGHFSARCFNLSNPSHEGYMAWYQKLVSFARELQNPALRFYCSN